MNTVNNKQTINLFVDAVKSGEQKVLAYYHKLVFCT